MARNTTIAVLVIESMFVIVGLVILFTGADLVGGYGFFVSGTIAKVIQGLYHQGGTNYLILLSCPRCAAVTARLKSFTR